MRNVIRDILTNWRNVLGKMVFPTFYGFPYIFVVTPGLASSIDIHFNSSTHTVITKITYTPLGGSEQIDTFYTFDGFSRTFTNIEPGTTFEIWSDAQNFGYIVVNGHKIYAQ